jgi:drug/metabolite transporter (DMT)-like permease
VILASFLVKRSPVWPRDPVALRLVLGVGFLDTISNALFLYAAQRGSLTVVAVLSSLYPVATVILARSVLHERLTRLQLGGFVLAMGATAMIGAG